VERTQELLTDLVRLTKTGAIEKSSIIVGSPLATRASEFFHNHARKLENGDLLAGSCTQETCAPQRR
jgi:metallo-beta-lactamase family protein